MLGCRELGATTFRMLMPETTMDEDHARSSLKNDVWLSWDVRAVQPISDPQTGKRSPHGSLGVGVLASNTGHQSTPLCLT